MMWQWLTIVSRLRFPSLSYGWLAGKIMAGIDQDDDLNTSAQLLLYNMHTTLCHSCRTQARKGPLHVSSVYTRVVVKKAFEGFREWEIIRNNGHTSASVSI